MGLCGLLCAWLNAFPSVLHRLCLHAVCPLQVDFEKPNMPLDILIKYGKFLVEEQDNVKRVQLADAYLAGAELAGTTGSSMPEAYRT